MAEMLDLNLLPVSRYNGQDHPELLGLHFSGPPIRAARGRNNDRMVLYAVMGGNAPLPPDQRDQVLADLSKLYFQTLGSVTAALRLTANEMNRLLLERNRQLGGARQTVGHLIQVVLRDGQITVAFSGLLHAVFVSEHGVEDFGEADIAGPGLGLQKNAPLSFIQLALKPNDTLILTTQQAPEWRVEVLKGIYGQGPESLRRRLFAQTAGNLNAVVLQAKQGKGNFYLLRPSPPRSAEEPPTGKLQPPAAQPIQTTAQTEAPAAPMTPVTQPLSPPSLQEKAPSISEEPQKLAQSAKQTGVLEAGLAARKKSPFGVWARNLMNGLKVLLGRLLPGELFVSIPSGVMAFVAVAVPVIIVAAASTAYFRLGRSAQYEMLSNQAKLLALQAMEQADKGVKRSDLGTALALLKRAEDFAATPETRAEIKSLRSQMQNELDALNFVRRVDYQSAIIGGLEVNSKIIGMAAFDDELYLLDMTSGAVIRAFLTDQGYDIDYLFNCKPGSYGEVNIGTFIKIIAWPAGFKPAAKVLAVDTNGGVLFCQTGITPIAERLTPGGEGSWGNLLSAALDQGDTYVLDLPSNGIWIYNRSNFKEKPTLFFDQAIPPLNEIIDMLAYNDDLYLLQSDGRMMVCIRDRLVEAPTRCHVQAYTDGRPGRETLPLVPSSPFVQIKFIPPPEPSLVLLEPKEQAIYHFSLRALTFQNQYLPAQPLPSRDATAFAFNQSRRYVYLALGNQVFYAAFP